MYATQRVGNAGPMPRLHCFALVGTTAQRTIRWDLYSYGLSIYGLYSYGLYCYADDFVGAVAEGWCGDTAHADGQAAIDRRTPTTVTPIKIIIN